MLTRIFETQDQLSGAEHKVANWVMVHPRRAVESATREIAQAAGVSEPTVIRFCRSIGCRGLRDFKVRLAQDLGTSARVVHADAEPDDDALALIGKVIGRSLNELSTLRSRLSAERVEQAIGALHAAQQIEFWGIGASGIVARDAQNKFFRLGKPCATHTDSATMRQAAALTTPRHAIVAVSKTGESGVLLDAVGLAREQHAVIVAITSPLSTLAGYAEVPLLVDSPEDTSIYTPMSSRLAALAVLDVLQVGLAMRMGERGAMHLRTTKAALLPR